MSRVSEPQSWEQVLPLLPMVGRENELSRLRGLIERGATLITLFGAAGVGKTRLALALLHSQKWRGQVCYCDLSEAKTPQDLCGALTRALALPSAAVDGRADPALALGQWIHEQGPELIVLDNFEQLVSSSAVLLARWREAAPGVCWLVASRQLLHLPGEEVLRVEVLPVPPEDASPEALEASEAVRLFLSCAKSELSLERDGAQISKIVRHLDGLPLALKLAAGRLEVLRIEELAARLKDPFPVLKDPGHSGRSSALWDAIEESWRLLSPEEQLVLRRVSVLVGGFTLEAAEAVAAEGAPVSILDALQLLYRKSMLRLASRESGRFGMYESVRAFAAQKLTESGERPEIEARHTKYFTERGVSFAEKAFGPEAPRCIKLLSEDHDNLNAILQRSLSGKDPASISAALACMRALCRSTYISWWVQTGHDLIEATIALADSSPQLSSKDRINLAWLLERLARNCTDQGKVDDAVSAIERGLGLARELGEKRLEGILLRRRANIHYNRGDREEAQKLNQQSLSLLRATKDTQQEGILRCIMGIQFHMAGQNQSAEESFLAALPLLQDEVDRRYEGFCYGRLGMIRMVQLRWEEARDYMERGLAIMREIGPSEAATARADLAVLSHLEGKLEDARQKYRDCIEILQRFKIMHYSAFLLHNLGTLELERRDLPEADKRLQEARKIFEKIRYWRDWALATAAYAGVCAHRGELTEAEALLRSAEPHAKEEQVVRGIISVYTGVLELARAEKLRDASAAPESAAQSDEARRLSPPNEERSRGASGSPESAAQSDEASKNPESAALHEQTRAFQRYEALLPFQQDDIMIALRILRRCVEDARARGMAWRIAKDGSFFQPPGSPIVSLAKRKTIARLLGALVEHRLRNQEEPLSLADLVEAGWPQTRSRWSSLTNNLHVTLSALRRVGLGPLLVRKEGGYLLDPQVPVLVDESAS